MSTNRRADHAVGGTAGVFPCPAVKEGVVELPNRVVAAAEEEEQPRLQ